MTGDDERRGGLGGVSIALAVIAAVVLYTKVPEFKDFIDAMVTWVGSRSLV